MGQTWAEMGVTFRNWCTELGIGLFKKEFYSDNAEFDFFYSIGELPVHKTSPLIFLANWCIVRLSLWLSASNCSDPTCGGRTIYSKRFFLFFVQTILVDRYIHRRGMRIVSLKSSSSVKFEVKKIFWFFCRGVTEDWRFVWTRDSWHDFVHFSVIFLRIKIFSMKIVLQNYISRHRINQFCVPHRRKAVKILVLVS